MRVSDRWVFFQSRSTSLGHEIERNNCVNLITRIEDMLNATELACVFRPGKTKAIFDEMESFIADRDTRALRISLKYLPFVHDVREIIANAAGRHALGLARSGKLGNRPLLLFLDEAHNFSTSAWPMKIPGIGWTPSNRSPKREERCRSTSALRRSARVTSPKASSVRLAPSSFIA
jgi:hypothetical protein